MKMSALSKYVPIAGLVVIVACALIHVLVTVKGHSTMLTALPLWMRVAFVLAFWVVVLGIGVVCYCLIARTLKK